MLLSLQVLSHMTPPGCCDISVTQDRASIIFPILYMRKVRLIDEAPTKDLPLEVHCSFKVVRSSSCRVWWKLPHACEIVVEGDCVNSREKNKLGSVDYNPGSILLFYCFLW